MPEKTDTVIEFEKLNSKAKEKVRDSEEWPEIARYYDRYHEVIQHNVGVHAWRQMIGLEPRGRVEYVNGSFVMPLRELIPKEEQWEFGPDKLWHKPDCEYRKSEYKEGICECNPSRKRMRFQKKENI